MPVLSQNLDFQRHMSWSFFVFSELQWAMIVCFAGIGGIVDKHCLNIFAITLKKKITFKEILLIFFRTDEQNKPESLSMISKSSPDFIARSLLGVNVNTRIVESENPTDIRLESSHILTVVTLKIKYIKCVIQSFMTSF